MPPLGGPEEPVRGFRTVGVHGLDLHEGQVLAPEGDDVQLPRGAAPVPGGDRPPLGRQVLRRGGFPETALFDALDLPLPPRSARGHFLGIQGAGYEEGLLGQKVHLVTLVVREALAELVHQDAELRAQGRVRMGLHDPGDGGVVE